MKIERGCRLGFTAIELMAVLAIAGMVAAMSVPAVLPALRQGHVNQASQQVIDAWRIARDHARSQPMPAAWAGLMPHYGIALIQDGGGTGVAVIHSTSDAAALGGNLATALLRVDPDNPSLDNSINPPVYYRRFPKGVVLATGRSGVLSTGAQRWLIYAQYGSGAPIRDASVAAGRGTVAPPVGFGVPGGPHPDEVLVQSVDYDGSAGAACSLSIFHMGIVACVDR